MAVKNHNFRFNEEKEAERKAWQILHSEEVKEDFRSQNEFVIAAINDYYARHLALKRDPYLESREKEDAFVKGIVKAVEQKVLDNLPGLAGMYMMQAMYLFEGMWLLLYLLKIDFLSSPRRLRAKYTHRTKLRFVLCVFRDCIEPNAGYGNGFVNGCLCIHSH